MMKRIIGTLIIGIFAVISSPASSQEEDEDNSRRVRTWSTRVAPYLERITRAVEEEDDAELREQLNKILSLSGISNYDRASATAFLGQLDLQEENYTGAREKLKQAVAIEEGLNPREVKIFTFSIGSLHSAEAEFNKAIDWYEKWLAYGVTPDASQYQAMAQTYAQAGDFLTAERYVEQAIAKAETPNQSQYQTALYIYSELKRVDKKLPLLKKMVSLWPDQRSYWLSLRGEYYNRGNEKEAFNVLQLAYKAGLLEKGDEIRVLAQSFDIYGDPIRGAEILEREMGAGTVERSVDNLKLLAGLYQNSRETGKALPLLAEAAKRSSDGEIYYQLAQTYGTNEEWRETRDNARAALRAGGLSVTQRGLTLLLLGNAQYGLGERRAAIETFKEALNSGHKRAENESKRWIEFIEAEIEAEKRRLRQIWQFEREEIEGEIQRCKQLRETLEIFGAGSGEVDEEELRKCDTAEERLKAHLADRPYENVELSTPEGEGAQSGR